MPQDDVFGGGWDVEGEDGCHSWKWALGPGGGGEGGRTRSETQKLDWGATTFAFDSIDSE
jgi:hypothetical protein